MDSTYRCQSRMRRNSFTTITTHITSAIPGSARSRPKVVRAVDVAGITLVGVIARVTSEIEAIVPPDRRGLLPPAAEYPGRRPWKKGREADSSDPPASASQ